MSNRQQSLLRMVFIFITIYALNSNAQEVFTSRLDERIYPPKLKWLTLEGTSQGRPFKWQQGRYLRLYFDKTPPKSARVWIHGKGGLFSQAQYTELERQWLIETDQNKEQLVLLEGFDDAYPIRIAQSVEERAPFLKAYSQPLFKDDKTVAVARVGKEGENVSTITHYYHELGQGSPFVQTLSGPGRYEFVFTTEWLAQYGNVNLMELKVAIEGGDTRTEVFKIQPQLDHLLKTPWCECTYSRQALFEIELPEGKHQVSLYADRVMLGYWRSIEASESYFFTHNAKLKYREKSAVALAPPELFFYRTLGALSATEVATVKSPVHVSESHSVGTIVDAPQRLFTQLSGFARIGFGLPLSTYNPPLRVMIEPGVNSSLIELITDTGERIELMRNGRFDQEQMPQQYVQFKKPYRKIWVKNLRGNVTSVNLAHKHLRPFGADEATFITAVNEYGGAESLGWLHDKNDQRGSSYLYRNELALMATRLRGRYQSFVERYPQQLLAGDLTALMTRLSQLQNQQLTTLAQWFEAMSEQGFGGTALRFLVATSMTGSAKWQQRAEAFVLARWAENEQWYNIEGYWAYRFLHDSQKIASVEIAKALLRQGKFELAAKWFYLATQAGYDIPYNEGFIAAKAAGLSALSDFFIDGLKVQPLPAAWPYWQMPANMTFSVSSSDLLYNKKLQSYLAVQRITHGQKHLVRLNEAGRVRLTLYSVKNCNMQWQSHEQLTISINGQKAIYKISGLADSKSMVSAVEPQLCLSSNNTVVIELPEHTREFIVKSQFHDAYVVVEQLADLILDWPQIKGSQQVVTRQQPSVPMTPVELAFAAQDNADYEWQRLQSIMFSGGSKLMSFNRWQGTSQAARWLEALLIEPVNVGEYLIPENGVEVLQINVDKKRVMNINVREIAQFGAPISPASVLLEVQGKTSIISLPYKGTFDLNPGNNFIRISLNNKEGFHLGKPAALNRRAWAFFSVDGYQLPATKRRFEVASKVKPLQVLIPAQSLVRIDDANGQSEKRYFSEQTILNLSPKSEQAETLYRLWRWQKKEQPQAQDKTVSSMTPPLSFSDSMVWPAPADDAFEMQGVGDGGQHSASSQGFFAGVQSRRNFDEAENIQNERFYQLGWHYRQQLPDWQSYFSSDLALRRHYDTQLQTLALKNDYFWEINDSWSFEADLDFFYQYQAHSPLIRNSVGLVSKVGVNYRRDVSFNSENRMSLDFVGRYLSLSPLNTVENGRTLAVDDDVFSLYKYNHRQGVELSDVWQYSPYRDIRIRVSASLFSNEQFDLFSPTRMRFGLGLRQYYEPFVMRVDFGHTVFRRENEQGQYDRTSRDTLRFGVLFEHWRPLGDLAQLELFSNHDFDSGETSFGIEFHWFITSGKGYEDFAPRNLVFGALRKRQTHRRIKSNQVLRQGDE